MRSVLYSGAFKPPHRGHFEVVKRLLNNTHGGQPYDIDSHKEAGTSALSGKKTTADKIDKVYKIERTLGLCETNLKEIWSKQAKVIDLSLIMKVF